MKNKAFTLTEIIITISIIGIMATIALPRISRNHERVIMGEAFQVLQVYHNAQQKWLLDHVLPYPNNCNAYELTAPASYRSFQNLTCAANGNISIQRQGGAYTLRVSAAGAYTCAAGTCPPGWQRLIP